MKMKTKNCGVFAALAAVLLLSAVLVTNCTEVFAPGDSPNGSAGKQTPNFVPPPGMGYVMLNFGERAGRTIRPDSSDFITDIDDFPKLTVFLRAVAAGGGTDVGPTDFSSDTSGGPGDQTAKEKLVANPFSADAGTYHVEVWAYDDDDAVQYTEAVAYGVSSLITVAANTGISASVELSMIIDAEVVDAALKRGKGTFAWDLTLGANTTSALLTVTTYPDGDPTALVSEPIQANLQDDEELDPGYYNVSIVLSGTGVKSATVREILHIYQGMTSTYYATLPDLNGNEYTITYSFNDGSPAATSDETETVTHGTAIAGPATDPTASGFYTGYTWQGWFTATSGGTEAVVNTYKPIRAQTLHGRWLSSGVNVTISFDPTPQPNDPVITLYKPDASAFTSSDTIDRDDPITITFGVETPLNGVYSDYEWSIASVDGLTGIDSTFAVNFANATYMDLLIKGSIRIQLNVKLDGQPLSTFVEIEVDEDNT